jgi:hypothetical protein
LAQRVKSKKTGTLPVFLGLFSVMEKSAFPVKGGEFFLLGVPHIFLKVHCFLGDKVWGRNPKKGPEIPAHFLGIIQ